MNITIEIPDEMNLKLASIQNLNTFILNAMKTALDKQIPFDNNKSIDSINKTAGILAGHKPSLKTLLATWTILDEGLPEIKDYTTVSEDIF